MKIHSRLVHWSALHKFPSSLEMSQGLLACCALCAHAGTLSVLGTLSAVGTMSILSTMCVLQAAFVRVHQDFTQSVLHGGKPQIVRSVREHIGRQLSPEEFSHWSALVRGCFIPPCPLYWSSSKTEAAALHVLFRKDRNKMPLLLPPCMCT
jgi:hypothetical protein